MTDKKWEKIELNGETYYKERKVRRINDADFSFESEINIPSSANVIIENFKCSGGGAKVEINIFHEHKGAIA